MAIVIGGRWCSTEAAYEHELGKDALARQLNPPEGKTGTGEQLKLVDVPKGHKPNAQELYGREGAA
jgi:hypothetical protein